jgi:threonine/homoserine/homoserine lactone efflux protein
MEYMILHLPSWPLLSAFLAASIVLAITPGPGVFYIVARSVVHGRRVGLMSVAGVAVGNFGNAAVAAAGLGALFAVSSFAFSVVKYAGAFYLVYLGVGLLRSKPAEGSDSLVIHTSGAGVFRDGFLVALLNPKTAIFFAAFLPQFMTPGSPPLLQSLLLGALFVVIAAMTDSIYALTASTVAPRASHLGRHGRIFSGGIFIGLGLLTALSGSRAAR